MASQTVVAVVLPAGVDAGGKLHANLYLTPRLAGATNLASFPDWFDWPGLIKSHGLTVDLVCGATTATVTVGQAALRPDAWHAIFTPETIVEPHPKPELSKNLIVSYPVRDAVDFMKYAFQFLATSAPSREGSIFETLLSDLVFRDGHGFSNLAATLSQLRVDLWQEQQGGVTPVGPPQPVFGSVGGVLTKPAGTRAMAERFALFHNMPPAPGRPALPTTPADFAKVLDFHKALTALYGHPALLVELGLVLPVEVPASLCPDSPASGTYGTLGVKAVHPGWKWSLTPTVVSPVTAYVRDPQSFAAAPRTSAGMIVGGGSIVPGDVVGGLLSLAPDSFQLIGVDIDGAMLKALSLADAVAHLAFLGDSSGVGDVLPALRSGGFSLIANDRAQQLLQAIRDNEALDAVLGGGPQPRPLDAVDLVRGFRIDVWTSRTGRWESLHRRDASYRLGPSGEVVIDTVDEEGFTQLAVAQPADDPTRPVDTVAQAAGAPQPGTDIYVHERVARWNGWSLSAPRPGLPLNRSPDPAHATDPDPTADEPITPFKLVSKFVAHRGSLPELRFGDRYRLRARAVDIAGHSVGLDAPAPEGFAIPPGGGTVPYLRYEPVGHPVVVERATPGLGGSHVQLVIRSANTDPRYDTAVTTETDERHIAPPRAPVLLVEHHGMLDDASGHLRGDQAMYDLVTQRDAGALPLVGGVPLEPAEQLVLPYFPDPLATGAAFAGLPNAPDDTLGVIGASGLTYETLPDVQPRPGSVTHVDFGTGWPELQPFRIRLAEGRGQPSWDATARVLTIRLPKAEAASVPLSCYILPEDLDLLGVWNWLRELFEAAEAVALGDSAAGGELVGVIDQQALMTRIAVEGGNEMLTPALEVSFVHAVQQPLGHPAWSRLPIEHRPASLFAAVTLANSYSPITAWRSFGSHHAVLLGALQIHGASTAAVDLDATWTEWVDEPSQPAPTHHPAGSHVDRITLSSLDGGVVAADGSNTRRVAVYLPKIDSLWFAAPFDQLAGVSTPGEVAAPIHPLGDTKHRRVRYRATASSRFQEYFPPGSAFTRSSRRLLVDVPSSARPHAPDVAYVVPTFGWERQETTNVKTEVRFGNGLRVYLNRPWYSSGEDELLGVVLWPSSEGSPSDDQREAAKAVITQWGLDPIWGGGSLTSVPATYDFTAASKVGTSLTLEKTTQLVDVAGHPVEFDPDRRLWYCDIEMDTTTSYTPFVRLALARYQPWSIAGVELSRVTLADFAQVAPDRSASLTGDPSDPTRARLVVGGMAPAGPTTPSITVTVEARMPGVHTDLGWAPAAPGVVSVIEDAPAPSQPASVLWSGTIVFKKEPAPGEFRVVIREFESLEIDPPLGMSTDRPALGSRIVYASILPFDFPAS